MWSNLRGPKTTQRDPPSLQEQTLPPHKPKMLCQSEKGKDLASSLPTRLRVSFSEPVGVGGSAPAASAPRKVYDTRDDDRAPGFHGDCDDDKYRRRPALGWLAQLLRYTGSGVARCQEWGGEEVRARGPRQDDCMTKGACAG